MLLNHCCFCLKFAEWTSLVRPFHIKLLAGSTHLVSIDPRQTARRCRAAFSVSSPTSPPRRHGLFTTIRSPGKNHVPIAMLVSRVLTSSLILLMLQK